MIILFDGQCGLCQSSVQFILKRDRAGVFRFASQQSAAGQKLMREAGVVIESDIQPTANSAAKKEAQGREGVRGGAAGHGGGGGLGGSVVVIDDAGVAHQQSDAVLLIAGRLPWPWSWAGLFRVLPRGLRDWAYRWLARNRYRFFGKTEACMMPTPQHRVRFLD